MGNKSQGGVQILAFFTNLLSCDLLYALFIFKHVRHICCLSLHVNFNFNVVVHNFTRFFVI